MGLAIPPLMRIILAADSEFDGCAGDAICRCAKYVWKNSFRSRARTASAFEDSPVAGFARCAVAIHDGQPSGAEWQSLFAGKCVDMLRRFNRREHDGLI